LDHFCFEFLLFRDGRIDPGATESPFLGEGIRLHFSGAYLREGDSIEDNFVKFPNSALVHFEVLPEFGHCFLDGVAGGHFIEDDLIFGLDDVILGLEVLCEDDDAVFEFEFPGSCPPEPFLNVGNFPFQFNNLVLFLVEDVGVVEDALS
jgi:hypothetical protein